MREVPFKILTNRRKVFYERLRQVNTLLREKPIPFQPNPFPYLSSYCSYSLQKIFRYFLQNSFVIRCKSSQQVTNKFCGINLAINKKQTLQRVTSEFAIRKTLVSHGVIFTSNEQQAKCFILHN